MKRIARSAIVECSAAEFYALAEDIEAYPAFLPWCAATQVRERTPGRTVATLTLAAKGLRQSFTTENSNKPGRAIDMRLAEGPFRRFVARLLDPVFSRIADSTVEAFARRAAGGGHA
jgi:ribosome-associated toxin RatA of RatAB toxin-antitoxin module